MGISQKKHYVKRHPPEIPNFEVLLDSARGDRLRAQGAPHLRDRAKIITIIFLEDLFLPMDDPTPILEINLFLLKSRPYLEMPPDDNIGSALPMLGCNLCNFWVLQHLKEIMRK